MRDLSLHILDIAQNSIRANATCIKLIIEENIDRNLFEIRIEDNGGGMDDQIKEHVTNPFTTTRTLRKVGLGIPFLKQICEECEGELNIESEKGKGTTIKALMKHNHIDRLPLGEIDKTITTLIMARSQIHYIYEHKYNDKAFILDTEEIKEILEGVAIDELDILKWIEAYIQSKLEELRKD